MHRKPPRKSSTFLSSGGRQFSPTVPTCTRRSKRSQLLKVMSGSEAIFSWNQNQIPMVNMDDVDIKKRSSMDDVGMKVFFS